MKIVHYQEFFYLYSEGDDLGYATIKYIDQTKKDVQIKLQRDINSKECFCISQVIKYMIQHAFDLRKLYSSLIKKNYDVIGSSWMGV